MGIPLTGGRFFSASDRPDDEPVIIIDEKMARRFWPNESALGKRVKPGPPDSKSRWRTIVGVVGSVKQYGLEVEGRMVVYYSVTQNPIGGLFAVARTDGDPGAISGSVVRAIRSMSATASSRFVPEPVATKPPSLRLTSIVCTLATASATGGGSRSAAGCSTR